MQLIIKLNYNISTVNPNCVCSIFPVSFQMLTRESVRGRVPLTVESVLPFWSQECGWESELPT